MKFVAIGDDAPALAIAVAAGQHGADVSIVHGDKPALAAGSSSLEFDGILGEGAIDIVYTSDPASVITPDTVIVVGGELSDRSAVANSIAPVTSDSNLILLSPGGFGGALGFAAVLQKAAGARPVIAEAPGFPYTAELGDGGKLTVKAVKRNLPVGVFPSNQTDDAFATLSSFLTSITPAASVLETSLKNSNTLIHPPIALLNAARIENGETFRFYREGLSPAAGRLVEEIDEERRRVARALDVDDTSLAGVMTQFYGDQGMGSGGIYAQLLEFPPFDGSLGPTFLSHRYVMDDIPFGIAPMAMLGDLVGEPMPATRRMIDVWSSISGEDLWAKSVTVEEMGIAGMSPVDIKRFVETGNA